MSPTATVTGWTATDLESSSRWTRALPGHDRQSIFDDALAGRWGAGEPARAELTGFVLDSLRSRGFAHVTGFMDPSLAEDDLATALKSVLAGFGEVVPQNAAGALTQVLREKDDEGLTELGFHCDTSDLLVLVCLQKAVAGGALRLASARHIVGVLAAEDPTALATLRQDWYFDRRGRAGEQIIKRPIFRHLPDGSEDCYYQSRTVRNTPSTYGPAFTPEQVHALAVLDDVLQRPTTGYDLLMQPGDLMVIWNNRVMHGRRPFVNGEGPLARGVLRAWMNSDQV